MSLFSTKVAAPPERDLARETSDTLETKIRLAPDVFKATASQEYGDPAYARMQMDMLREHAPDFRDMAAADATAQRAADVGDLARLGPEMTEAIRAANPQQAALLDEMHRTAMERLQRGGELHPEEMRLADQEARAAYSARGRVRGSEAVSAELLNRHGLRRMREDQAFGQAGQMAGLQAGMMTDPSMAILGRPGMTGSAQAQFQPGMAFNPFDPYAAGLYQQNQQHAYGANMASASMRAGLAGGLIGAGGMMGGAFLGNPGRV